MGLDDKSFHTITELRSCSNVPISRFKLLKPESKLSLSIIGAAKRVVYGKLRGKKKDKRLFEISTFNPNLDIISDDEEGDNI